MCKKMIVVLMVVSMVSIASANLLVNPSFETEGSSAGLAAGWYESGDAASVFRHEYLPHGAGDFSIALRHGTGTFKGVYQSVATTIAEDDVLTFSAWVYAVQGEGYTTSGKLSITAWDGTVNHTLASSVVFDGLTSRTYTQITATVDISTLDQATKDAVIGVAPTAFIIGYGGYSWVDDASFTSVPEPATMALLGLGGLLLRRRKA